MDLEQREIKENNKQINSSAPLSLAEKKAPYEYECDIGINIGSMSVTELAERWELNKHLFNVKFGRG